MKYYRAIARASVECELFGSFASKQDDNKNKFLLGKAKAIVTRNLGRALLLTKRTVK